MANKYNKAAVREVLVNKLAEATQQLETHRQQKLSKFSEWQTDTLKRLEELKSAVNSTEVGVYNDADIVISRNSILRRPDLSNDDYTLLANVSSLEKCIKEIDLIDGTTISSSRDSASWLIHLATS